MESSRNDQSIVIKHSCEFCEYEATTKSNLHQHVQSIHNGVKHSCEFCEYKFQIEKTLFTDMFSLFIMKFNII